MELELNEKEKKKILNQVYFHTNPTKPHEAQIISSILKIHTGEHHWRFQKHVFCEGCRRELTILDYFLSALKHHPVEFILSEICPDYEKDGTCDHDADVISVEKVDVVEHGLDVACINCGVIKRNGYALYLHPGCKGYVIRMSEAVYSKLQAELK